MWKRAELARRVLARSGLDDAGRINLAYRLALCRPATAKEIDRAKDYITAYEAAAQNNEPSAGDPAADPWTSFCQALLASAEFRYVR